MMLALTSAAWGQQAVSARAGLIQYVEGRVLLDEKAIAPKVNEFIQVEKGQTLSTEDGRAEVLLTPGAFLRLSENSSFRMINGGLTDTRLEVLSGSAMVEVEELLRDNAITLVSGNASISLKKHGLYRVDASDGAYFRVYDGEALITSGDQLLTAKKGRQVELDETLARSKFDTDVTDAFYRWSQRRAGYVATANVSSARSVAGGAPGSFLSSLQSRWIYNPWFGMYTYVPYNGFGYSPFGYAIYSPVTVRYVVVQAASTGPQTTSFAANPQRTASPPTMRDAQSAANPVALRGGGIAEGGGGYVGGSSAGGSVVSAGGGGGSAPEARSAPAPSAPAAAPASVNGPRGR